MGWGIAIARCMHVLLAGVFATALLGCGALRGPLTCPEHGGPDWIQAESAHFRLRTDLPESTARARLVAFEQSFQLLSDLAFRSSDPPTDRIDVVVFDRRKDYEEIGPAGTDGFFTTVDLDARPLIVMYGSFSDVAREIFQHELTHRFVRYYMPRAPLWLNEGFAGFYQTLAMNGDRAVIGAPSAGWRFKDGALVTGGARRRLPSATELIGASPLAFRDPDSAHHYYAGSWLLVSTLIHGSPEHQDGFWSFVHLLADGRPAKAAWQGSFTAASTAALDEAFAANLARGEVVVRRVPAAPRAAPIEALSRMSEAEIHTLWAQLRTRWGDEGERKAADELEEALARSPGFAEAQHWKGILALRGDRFDEAEGHFRAALAESPSEERYLQGLCNAMFDRAMSRPRALRDFAPLRDPMRRLARIASSSSALNALGWYHAMLDEPDEGWPFAERAVQIEPSCWECLDTLALLAFQQGRPGEALELQQWVISIMPESAKADGVIERLRRYERAVPPPPARPTDDPGRGPGHP